MAATKTKAQGGKQREPTKIPRKQKKHGKNVAGMTVKARAGRRKAGKEKTKDGMMTGKKGHGETVTRVLGLRALSPLKKGKEPQAAAQPQAATYKDKGWPN